MSAHDLWHVFVLGTTLFAAAAAALVLLGPVLFEEPPPGLARARPLVAGLGAGAILLLALEWLKVH